MLRICAGRRLLDDSGRTGVRPDSVQAFDGMLSTRLPTRIWVWLSIGLRAVVRRAEAWLQRDCPALNSNARLAIPTGSNEAGGGMAKVFIGVDPHKLSATIEVVDDHETVLAAGRFGSDKAGYAAMREVVTPWPDRVWAVEGSNGSGRPLAQRLLADGEHVVDVPAKLSARARLLTPATPGRPMPTTRTRSQWSRSVLTGFGCCPTTGSSRRCGCWPTAVRNSPGPGSRRSTGSTGCWPS